MFSPIEGRHQDRLYQLCELSDSDNTKKKHFCCLHHEAFKEEFNGAGIVPYDPQSVIDPPDVIKTTISHPRPQSTNQPPKTPTTKVFETDLYHISTSQIVTMDGKLKVTHWIATRAIEILGTRDVEIVQQHIKCRILSTKKNRFTREEGYQEGTTQTWSSFGRSGQYRKDTTTR
jgi:hypothetical protein